MTFSPRSSKAVLICAAGLLAAFFMPWVQILGIGVSGYNLGSLGSYGNYAWVVPIFAGGTVLVSFTGRSNRGLGAVAGLIPLGALLYTLLSLASEAGGSAIQDALGFAGHVFSVGAWLTIIFSVGLIVSALVGYPVEENEDQLSG